MPRTPTSRKVSKTAKENSGRSRSTQNPKGQRTKKQGRELAPHALRKDHTYMDECSSKELERIGLD